MGHRPWVALAAALGRGGGTFGFEAEEGDSIEASAASDSSGDDDDYVDPLALLAATHRPIRLKPTLPGDGVG